MRNFQEYHNITKANTENTDKDSTKRTAGNGKIKC
jgi:hypothetical protein